MAATFGQEKAKAAGSSDPRATPTDWDEVSLYPGAGNWRAVRLLPGDLALVVGGPDHHIAHEPDALLCMSHERFWARDVDDGDNPDPTIFLCGAYRLAGDVGRDLIQALPPMLVIRPAPHDQAHDVVSLISRELSHSTPGQQTVPRNQSRIGANLDPEELKLAEFYLAETQRLAHIGSCAWQIAGGHAVHLSEGWYCIFGFDPRKGMPRWEERLQRVYPEDRGMWQGTIERAIRERSDHDLEYRILLPDGRVRWFMP